MHEQDLLQAGVYIEEEDSYWSFDCQRQGHCVDYYGGTGTEYSRSIIGRKGWNGRMQRQALLLGIGTGRDGNMFSFYCWTYGVFDEELA